MEVAVLVFAGVLVGGAWSAPTNNVATPELTLQPPAFAVPVIYVSRHHAQDELGQVNYGFSHPGQAKNELRDASGNVAGVYTYVDADDKVVRVEYTAGEAGFQVKSNNLPIAVKDTPEVIAAKLQFVEAYNAAALAAAAAPDDATTGGNSQSADSDTINIAIPTLVTSSYIRDTPEVIAAKLQFVEAYNAAALAAANAPDDPVESSAGADESKTKSVNLNPVRDTPEVVAAKLQFVEAYNAAALRAANAANNPEHVDISAIKEVYATHSVQDTPEVIAAKLQFVEAYNAAAIAAANAPDDEDVSAPYEQHETEVNTVPIENPFETEEPVTELGLIQAQEPEVTVLPEEEETEAPAVLTFKVQEPLQKQKTVETHELVPIKVHESPAHEYKQSEIHELVPTKVSESPVHEYKQPASDNLHQVQSYNLEAPAQLLHVETPVLSPVVPPTVLHPPVQEPVSVTYVSRHHAQDELGQVNYGFSHPGQAKNEIRDASGNVAGVYTYIDAENKVIRVEYTAGEDGFQVRSNNLPVAVRDTPEVLAAKLQFVEAFNAAALAAAAAPDDNESAHLEQEDNLVSRTAAFVIRNPVRDTPEVIAAKMQFVEAYNKAALAAANAPDDPVDLTQDAVENHATYVNHNPIRDTPEVMAAKLQFVEAYNTAALAAAAVAENPEAADNSISTISYATPKVQDTPEVTAAKLQFVEAYNAAAIAAASAPDEPKDTIQTAIFPFTVSRAPKIKQGNEILLPTIISEYSNININEVPAPALKDDNEPQDHVVPSILLSPVETLLAPSPTVPILTLEDPAYGPAVTLPSSYINRHHAQDELGQVNYGFSHPGQAKNELRDASGNVVGFYTYTDSENKEIRVEYTAGEDGFQVQSNNLPVGVSDTPEVLAAKMQFVEAYNAAALAAAAAPDINDGTQSGTDIPVAYAVVKDTPEVVAAKLKFVEDYNAAALAAANAPLYNPTDSAADVPETVTNVNSNPIRDTPEVTAAKLKFVEAYNAAALAAATASNYKETQAESSKATEDHVTHVLQDTPEVIAAKLQFVEAYNAAALAAALAPDDDMMYNASKEKNTIEMATLTPDEGEVDEEELSTEMPQDITGSTANERAPDIQISLDLPLTEDSYALDILFVPEVPQGVENPEVSPNTGTILSNEIPLPLVKAKEGQLIHISPASTGSSDGLIPAQYSYMVGYGGLQPIRYATTLPFSHYGFQTLPAPYLSSASQPSGKQVPYYLSHIPIPSYYQSPEKFKHTAVYAPLHTYTA